MLTKSQVKFIRAQRVYRGLAGHKRVHSNTLRHKNLHREMLIWMLFGVQMGLPRLTYKRLSGSQKSSSGHSRLHRRSYGAHWSKEGYKGDEIGLMERTQAL